MKHNAQKLIQSSASYFETGQAFVKAGHQFAQDMLRYAPCQSDEWELQKGSLMKGNKGIKLGKKKKLDSYLTTMKDLDEDIEKTRKLQIVAEELTLLIREGMVHLDVMLSQQEEILIKPLEHLVSVQSKVCKQTKERYDREKKLYLNALSKYQSMKKGDSKTVQMKKEGKYLSEGIYKRRERASRIWKPSSFLFLLLLPPSNLFHCLCHISPLF